MKVLLIHNKDITMEYLEGIMESKGIGAEVIVALPDAFTLEVMRNIPFDMVIGSIQLASMGVIEHFLGEVRTLDNGEEIYTYMAIEKETLSMLDQDVLNVVDDFISFPLDRDEFGCRLAKAAKRLLTKRGAGASSMKKEYPAAPARSLEMERVRPEHVVVKASEAVQEQEMHPAIVMTEVDSEPKSSVEAEVDENEADIEEIETEAEEVEVEAEEAAIEAEEDEVEAEEAEIEVGAVDPEFNMEPSYDELLRARELRREKEKAEYEKQEKLKWERIEEAARKAALEHTAQAAALPVYQEKVVGDALKRGTISFETTPAIEEGQSYHDLAVRTATAGMPEPLSGAVLENDLELRSKEVQMEEIPCEPSYEDLVRERELRLQRDQEEARRQSMAKKFSGFNLDQEAKAETSEHTNHPEPGLDSHVLLEDHRPTSKAETIQEEIDLLKHLRKDYNVKATKVHTVKFKKQKKHSAGKRDKSEGAPGGILAKVSKVFLLLLLVVLTTTAILFFTGKFEGGLPVVLNMDSLSNLWGMLK